MGLLTGFKVRSALLKHQRGEKEQALQMYEDFYKQGILLASYMLPYSVLLLRSNTKENYQKVKEVLVKAQKAPDLKEDQRQQLLMNYAVACWKLDDKEKAITTLEAAHRKSPCGMVYETLGYLYVEMGDAEKALQYNKEALEYDDEDSIVLDNMGQTYYRLMDDKETAKAYFEKALEIKPGQIDTLYFLSRYDLEKNNIVAAIEKLEMALEGNFSPLNYVSQNALEEEVLKLKERRVSEGKMDYER